MQCSFWRGLRWGLGSMGCCVLGRKELGSAGCMAECSFVGNAACQGAAATCSAAAFRRRHACLWAGTLQPLHSTSQPRAS